MKVKQIFNRYPFLMRLIGASSLLLVAAILFSQWFVFRAARKQLLQANNQQRISDAHTFSDYFHERMTDLMGNAVRIR